ncbi:WD domain, G-beta repeat [Planctomycetes bacterium Pan216]|uniref:WD domain, G-beta repeat n=1 Tax=Kolteria novifilia TaxID=2527975 RepID=A0A518AZR9_9BACT|nr:WD domain, G-beta repeat [Planctomycetes bacterium Pan216]
MDIQKTHVEAEHAHDSPLISCRFSPSGEEVVFGAEDFHVHRWNANADRKVSLNTEAWVRALAFAGKDGPLITGGYDGRLMWWPDPAASPKPIRTIDAHEGWIRAIAISPDGARLASVGNDRAIRLWKVADGAPIHEFEGTTVVEDKSIGHESHIYNVAFHPGGTSLVTGDLKGQLIEWDLKALRPKRSWTAESLSKYDKTFRAQIGGFRDLLFDASGSKLFGSGITKVTNAFAGVGNPSVVEFNWDDGKQLNEYLTKPKLQGVAWRTVLHPDGPIIAAHGGSGGSLVFWKPGQTDSTHQVKLPQNARDLDLHPDGKRLAVACSDSKLRLCLMEAKAN